MITHPPNVSSHREERTEALLSGSRTALVVNGWATRSHWVRIVCRAPAHCPGPLRRYWYGVQGPKTTWTQSAGSLRSNISRFGRTPICNCKSNMIVCFVHSAVWYVSMVPQCYTKMKWTDLFGYEIQVWDVIYLESRLFWAGIAEETMRGFAHCCQPNMFWELQLCTAGMLWCVWVINVRIIFTFSCFFFSQSQWFLAFLS